MVPKTCVQAECHQPQERRNGRCDSHYRKWLRETPREQRRRPTVEERFWAMVTKTPTCWAWSGEINPGGYAIITIRSVGRLAHRYIFESIHGLLPADIQVDHKCHNHSCVNPEHLRRATNKQNQENREGAQANNATSGIRGVSWNKRIEKWHAYVGHHGKRIHLGFFEDPQEAEAAAVAKRLELYTHNLMDIREIGG